MHHTQTSLADALATPELARACCGVYDTRTIPGSPSVQKETALKVLRLVSKELRIAMLPHIQHYNLLLGGATHNTTMRAVKLMQHAKLSSLCVHFGEGDYRAASPARLKPLQKQLDNFITRMGPSLRTVTTLTMITINPGDDEEEFLDLSEQKLLALPLSGLLARLAPACPALSNLCMHGLLHKDAVQAFGASCPQLTHLNYAPSNLYSEIIQQLPQLLPCVRNLAFHPISFGSGLRRYHQILPSVIRSLAARNFITHLDLGPRGAIVREVWAHLPSSLRVLLICNPRPRYMINRGKQGRLFVKPRGGPAPDVRMPCLQQVSWECNIQDLTDLLLAAPNLQLLDCSIHAPCSPDVRPSCDMVCARAALRGDMSLNLHNEENTPFSDFLSQLQPMPNIMDLNLSSSSDSTHVSDANCLGHIARVFPGLQDLTMFMLAITDDSLHALLPCHNMRDVFLDKCEQVTESGLVMIAVRLPLLQHLNVAESSKIDWVCGNRMNHLFELYGMLARVIIYDYN